MDKYHIPRGHGVNHELGIGYVIGEISVDEHNQNRPLLSAIVVRKNSRTQMHPHGYPGSGFFGLPGIPAKLQRKEPKYSNPLSEEDKKFIIKEQQKIWRRYRPGTKRF